MGWLKKSFNFNKHVFGGGWARDLMGGAGGNPGAEQLRQIIGTLEKARGESAIGYAQAGAQQKRAIPLVQKAYKQEGENLRYLADSTKRLVSGREPAQLARAGALVADQGGGASNLAVLAGRGVRGDTTRALTEIDRMFGDRFGQLQTRQSADVSTLMNQQANLQAQGVNAQNSLYGAMAEAYGKQQFTPKKDLFDVIGAAAPIIGTFAGLGGGGGASSFLSTNSWGGF